MSLVHGGLRLRAGYMLVHRRMLEHCLTDTFGTEYVEHLERWLEADGIGAQLAGES